MRRGCLLPLLGFLLLFGLYVIVWKRLIPDPVVPFFLGLFTAIGAGGLINGFLSLLQSHKLGSAIRRDGAGVPRRDGRFEAAGGEIQPMGEALISPFQGVPCVAYEYDVIAEGKDAQPAGSDAWGWSLTPAIIRTEREDLHLLGFPDLEPFDRAVVGEGGRERIRDYFRSTRFETIGRSDIKKGLGQLLDRSWDDDGLVRADVRRGTELNPEALCFEQRQFSERVIPLGAEVTAFGIYSADRGGLISHGGKLSKALQVRPGTGEELAAVIEKESYGRLHLGILVFVLTHAFSSITIFILWLKGYYA